MLYLLAHQLLLACQTISEDLMLETIHLIFRTDLIKSLKNELDTYRATNVGKQSQRYVLFDNSLWRASDIKIHFTEKVCWSRHWMGSIFQLLQHNLWKTRDSTTETYLGPFKINGSFGCTGSSPLRPNLSSWMGLHGYKTAGFDSVSFKVQELKSAAPQHLH